MKSKTMTKRITISAITIGLLSAPAFADKRDNFDKWIKDNIDARKYTPEETLDIMPPGPHPMLSIRPEGAASNESFWRARAVAEAARANESNPKANVRLQYKKNKGLSLKGFGTGKSRESAIDITGTIELPAPIQLTPNLEDEGSIDLATDTMLVSGNAVVASGFVGDGPFGISGTGSGDVDFYEINGVVAGQIISINVDTPVPFVGLDSFVSLWNSDGELIEFNDDDGTSFDSELIISVPEDGTYYAAVTGFGTFITNDPFDSSSGLGAGSEGAYDVTIGLDYVGIVDLSFQLKKGEIFGATVNPEDFGRLTLFDKTGLERQGSSQNSTDIHPEASPLPSNGSIALSHAVDTTGNFSLRAILPEGDYEIALRAFTNPLKDGSSNDVQTVFIDFDGATVDTGALFAGLAPGLFVSNLSPLVDFLPNWGLSADDEDAVIDAIMREIEETLVDDVKRGREPTQEIVLLNSRDNADPGEAANVSRIVVGGTIAEFFIRTIGIAQSIDVGNFETSETAVVLLDLLSAPATNPNSLNQFELAPGASIIDLIGVGVGNITSHEAGHFLGNWHTDQFNDLPSIQDQGGNLPNFVGLGEDGIFGTSDDVDVDFGRDEFVPAEGFTGIEDTLNSIAIGTPTPRGNGNKGKK